MWRNYGLPAANILVSSLPLLMTWDPVVGICYCGILALFLALFSWNVVGDFAVVSLALEDRLQQNGERLLIKGVPKDAYIPKIMISRKAALLSLTSYAVVIRIMELWVHYLAVREKWLMRYLSARQSEALC